MIVTISIAIIAYDLWNCPMCLELYFVHLIKTSSALGNKWCSPHFTNEEIESQRGKASWPRSHGWSLARLQLGHIFEQWCSSLNTSWPCVPGTRIQWWVVSAVCWGSLELPSRGKWVGGKGSWIKSSEERWLIILFFRRYHIPYF